MNLVERLKNITLEACDELLDVGTCIYLEQNKICVDSEEYPEDGHIICFEI